MNRERFEQFAAIAERHGGAPVVTPADGFPRVYSFKGNVTMSESHACDAFLDEAEAAGFDVWGSINVAGLRSTSRQGEGKP